MWLNIFLILKWLILRNLYTTLRWKGSHTKWVEERQEDKFEWSYNVWRKLPFSSDIETTITQLAYSASQLNPVSCRPQRCHFKMLSFIMQPTPHHHPPVLQIPKSSLFLIPTFIKTNLLSLPLSPSALYFPFQARVTPKPHTEVRVLCVLFRNHYSDRKNKLSFINAMNSSSPCPDSSVLLLSSLQTCTGHGTNHKKGSGSCLRRIVMSTVGKNGRKRKMAKSIQTFAFPPFAKATEEP